MIGGLDYDKVPDFNELNIRIGEHIQTLQDKWHTHELPRLKRLIRSTLCAELSRLEERKFIRREAKEIARKKAEAEEEAEA